MTVKFGHDPITGDIVRRDDAHPDLVETFTSRRKAKARLKRRSRTDIKNDTTDA